MKFLGGTKLPVIALAAIFGLSFTPKTQAKVSISVSGDSNNGSVQVQSSETSFNQSISQQSSSTASSSQSSQSTQSHTEISNDSGTVYQRDKTDSITTQDGKIIDEQHSDKTTGTPPAGSSVENYSNLSPSSSSQTTPPKKAPIDLQQDPAGQGEAKFGYGGKHDTPPLQDFILTQPIQNNTEQEAATNNLSIFDRLDHFINQLKEWISSIF